jgi:hypothetical protein
MSRKQDLRVVREELPPRSATPRRHLISISDLTRADVARLLETARRFGASLEREMKKLPTLRGRTVVTLFYESSTRTSSSFELAAKRLSAVRWGVAKRIVWAWILTLPMSAAIAALSYLVLSRMT